MGRGSGSGTESEATMQVSKRSIIIMAVTAGITIGVGILSMALLVPHLIINTTPSAPVGLYWLTKYRETPTSVLKQGDQVIFIPPIWIQEALHRVAPGIDAERPWMKRVVAGPGDTVCMDDNNVIINNVWIAHRPLLQSYPVAVPTGCETLKPERYFVMNDHPQSFDSRYVGPVPRAFIHGTVRPVWTWGGQE
jgi:conjugative transfer signal peptidase TraF